MKNSRQVILFYQKEWDPVVNIKKNEIENYFKSEIKTITTVEDLTAEFLVRIEQQLLKIFSLRTSDDESTNS